MKQTKQGNVTVRQEEAGGQGGPLWSGNVWVVMRLESLKSVSYERTLWKIVPGEGRVRGGKELGL